MIATALVRGAAIDALGEVRGQSARYSRDALSLAMEQYDGGQDEKERAAFAAAVSDWRKAGDGQPTPGRASEV